MTFKERTLCRGAGTGKSRAFLPVFLVSCLSFAVYATTLTHGLLWDDNGVLDHIKTVTGEGGFPALFTSRFATHVEEGYVSGYYRPVSMWSLNLDSFYVRFLPFQYHLMNILLHVLNTVLVFLLICVLANPAAAFIGSAIFAIHPVHVGSVVFVSGRTDLMATLFVILSTIFFIRVRNGRTPGKTLGKMAEPGSGPRRLSLQGGCLCASGSPAAF